jgi:hypothetical protein
MRVVKLLPAVNKRIVTGGVKLLLGTAVVVLTIAPQIVEGT